MLRVVGFWRTVGGVTMGSCFLHQLATLIVAALSLFTSICPVCAEDLAASARRPNIVLILADDLGYSDLGCYGSEISTPNLDRLAANGVRFTQFYNTARCWPSRAAALTGYYAQQVRRDAIVGGPKAGGKGQRPAWARLLPEMLRPAGYRTYHSGKWHIDGKPLENGFDRSYELAGPGQSNYFKAAGNTDDGKQVPQSDDYYATTAIADHAIRCLVEHAQQHGERPFFHYLCFTSPHFPLHAPASDIARYTSRYREGWNAVQQERYQRMKSLGIVSFALPAMEREVGPPYDFPEAFKILGPGELNRPLPWNELSAQQHEFQAAKMAVHAAMVDRMDQEIGRVLDQLKKMNALDNTLILFASDNGASAEIMVRGDGHDPEASPGSAKTFLCLGPGWSSVANTPLRRHKTWVHEGGINTPLIAHWPKGIAARGELRHQPAHLIDWVPTVLEAAGARRFETWNDQPVPTPPGKSLLPAFARDYSVEHDYLWWLHEGNRALRMGDWKIVAAGETAAWELYDLKNDRGETKNLAAEQPQRVRELADRWNAAADEFRQLANKDLPADRIGWTGKGKAKE